MKVEKSKRGAKYSVGSDLKAIRPSKVPKVLREGAFYASLDTEDDAAIMVPEFATKANLILRNNKDLSNLLSSLRFWGVDIVPDRILAALLLMDKVKVTQAVVHAFQQHFPIIASVRKMQNIENTDTMDRAVKVRDIELVCFLHRRGFKSSLKCSYFAAECGHIPTLKFAHQHGIVFDEFTFHYAAQSGNLEVIKFLHGMNCPIPDCIYRPLVEPDKCNLDILEYALAHNFPGANTYFMAVVFDDNVCALALFHKYGHSLEVVLKFSVLFDCVKCLQYCHEQGEPWNPSIKTAAEDRGSEKCLEYIRTHAWV